MVAVGVAPSLPRSPWQNPYAERLIGSIRRECLNHFVIVNAKHLKRTLTNYLRYQLLKDQLQAELQFAHVESWAGAGDLAECTGTGDRKSVGVCPVGRENISRVAK